MFEALGTVSLGYDNIVVIKVIAEIWVFAVSNGARSGNQTCWKQANSLALYLNYYYYYMWVKFFIPPKIYVCTEVPHSILCFSHPNMSG